MRKILYYSETQFITIRQELELVDTYLDLELLRLKDRFKIHRKIDLPEIDLHKFLVPSLLLQPILENAIWHGLKFRENKPELLISLHLNQNQELVIQISDNGPGFNLSNKTEGHLSKGNKLITERIDALNQQFQKQVAKMSVLTDSSGTKVIFTFTPDLYQSSES
jgi:LytS/YehU family sensor histidine kinase